LVCVFEALIAPIAFALIALALVVGSAIVAIRRRATRATESNAGKSTLPSRSTSASEDAERRRRRTG